MIEPRKPPNFQRKTAYLLSVNAAITVLVLLSPFGLGDGSGVIGYSVIRLVIAFFVQTPIALAAIVASFQSFRNGLKWHLGLVVNILLSLCTVILYFAQSQTIQRFM